MAYQCSDAKIPRIEENLNLDDTRFDDCWIHVFNHLPFKKRILLERVSQKWKKLMPYCDIYSLHLTEFDWPESKRINKQYCIEPGEGRKTVKLVPDDDLRQILESALNRMGPHMKELDFKVETEEFIQKPIFRLSKDLMDFVVEKAPNLTRLKFTRCLMTLGCFPALLNLGKLEALDLSRVTIIEEDLSVTVEDLENVKTVVGSTIQNLPSLKKLDVAWKMAVAPPVWNPNLIDLCMDGQEMKGEDVRVIIQCCPNLEVLQIDRFIPGFGLADLSQLHHLRKLSLCFFAFENRLSSEDVVTLSKGCPNMETLHLISSDLRDLSQLWRLRNLKSLFLLPSWSGVEASEAAITSVAKNGLLESLLLPQAQLTDEALKYLAEKCLNLVSLDFFGVKGISDEGVKVILEKCKKLEKLFLVNTQIMDPTLTVIGAMMGSRLREVNLAGSKVTPNGLRSLFEERKKRLYNGGNLVKLEVLIDKECPISKENLEAVSLSVIWPKYFDQITFPEL